VRQDPARFALPPAAGPDELSQLAADVVKTGLSGIGEVASEPRFEAGDAVMTMRRSPAGHTRLPRYARGRRGSIARYHGGFSIADTLAEEVCECPEHLYAVRFEASELWGDSADGRGSVSIDLWESYLAPAGEDRA
jgi:hypothetical protein